MQILYYAVILPLLFTLLEYFKNDYEFCLGLFFLYVCTNFLNEKIVTKKTIENIGFPISTFLMNVAIKNKEYNGLTILLMSSIIFVMANVSDIKKDQRSIKPLLNVLSFVSSSLTYFYNSSFFGTIAMVFTFCILAMSSQSALRKFNEFADWCGVSQFLERNETNLFLVIWLQLKIYYIFINYFNFLRIFLSGFHTVAGVIFLQKIIKSVMSPRLDNENSTLHNNFVTIICLFVLMVTNASFLFRVALIASVLIYTFMYEYKIPQFQQRIISIVDLIFLFLLLNNLIY